VIVDLGLAPREAVEAAVHQAREARQPTGRLLVSKGLITEEQLARAVAERYGVDYVDLSSFRPDMAAASLISQAAARRYEAVPVAFVDDRTLLVAMADPANVLALDDIAMMTGLEVRRAVTTREDVNRVLSEITRLDVAVEEGADEPEETVDLTDLRDSAADAPVIKLVHSIIVDAVQRGASDIHFDHEEREMRIRMRVDGVVSDALTVPKRLVPGVVSRIKIMANLDIAEGRFPQDGRVTLSIDARQVDIRVVTLPSVTGESVVMRVLDKSRVVGSIDLLGMAESDRERFERAIRRPHGAVLVTGPTGSGKTTTLYAGLTALNTRERTLITIEDPVEYRVEGVKQVQVNPKIGLGFAEGLRSMLRADPEVMMVGEIRDRETAHIAIEAALTGHLVLSTLHTNDAPGAPTRLVEMGIEPFLVASALECVIAQRLIRTLCESCKRRVTLPAMLLSEHGFEAVGCGRCAGMGYRGRTGVYEVMTMTDELRQAVLTGESAAALTELALAGGMSQLRDDGLDKVREGETSLAEVVRVAGAS
jgi:type IV pilus assembly protein PilB